MVPVDCSWITASANRSPLRSPTPTSFWSVVSPFHPMIQVGVLVPCCSATNTVPLLGFCTNTSAPPLYDFIRYLLSFRSVSLPDIVDGTILDGRIYLFYCFIYASFNQLI